MLTHTKMAFELKVTKYTWGHKDFRLWGHVLSLQCPQCKGTGQKAYVGGFGGVAQCSNCHGSGVVKCGACSGKGTQ